MNSDLISSGQGPATVFDPSVLYQFKIDNTGDAIEATFPYIGAPQFRTADWTATWRAKWRSS